MSSHAGADAAVLEEEAVLEGATEEVTAVAMVELLPVLLP